MYFYNPDNYDIILFNNFTVVKRQCIISPFRDEGVYLKPCEVANTPFLFQSDIIDIYTRYYISCELCKNACDKYYGYKMQNVICSRLICDKCMCEYYYSYGIFSSLLKKG